MSYNERDKCDTTMQLKLREINRKASASVREDNGVVSTNIEVTESSCDVESFGEMLALVNNSNESAQNDLIREKIVQQLIDNDYD